MLNVAAGVHSSGIKLLFTLLGFTYPEWNFLILQLATHAERWQDCIKWLKNKLTHTPHPYQYKVKDLDYKMITKVNNLRRTRLLGYSKEAFTKFLYTWK